VPATKPTSKTPYADEVLRRDLDPRARKLIESIKQAQEVDTRDVLRRHERDALLGVGATRGRQLEREEIPAYLQDGHRLTPTSLIYEHKINAILKSFPLGEEPLRKPGAPNLRTRPISRYGAKAVKRPAPTVHERIEVRRAVLSPTAPPPVVPEPQSRVRPADAPRLGRPPSSKKKELTAALAE
jgi:hypothetical protein